MLDLLKLAAEYSDPCRDDERHFYLGAVGLRRDGRTVHSRNESVLDTHHYTTRSSFQNYKRFAGSHAEFRLTKKLGFFATVYVARVRAKGELAMARPCECCQLILKAFKVNKVYYTISSNQWGVWSPKDNTDAYYSK